jgi:hypothetical protein
MAFPRAKPRNLSDAQFNNGESHMGTRHLIAVQLDGQYRIAQYGQWDGNPSGQGEIVLNFLEEWRRPEFEAKLRAASFMTEEEMEALSARIEREGLEIGWSERWPELSRDAGAEILEMVQHADAGIKLLDEIGFATDSLFCEWAYVIDLDAETLEVFKGFQKEPLPETERFFGFELKYPNEVCEGYYPIRMIASYPLDAPPTLEQMQRDCYPS